MRMHAFFAALKGHFSRRSSRKPTGSTFSSSNFVGMFIKEFSTFSVPINCDEFHKSLNLTLKKSSFSKKLNLI